jgi:hypothetical protein
VRAGKVVGKTAPRHTSAEFIDFLTELSAHRTKAVEEFLEAHPMTNMRSIRIASNYDYPIIRMDTNQGDVKEDLIQIYLFLFLNRASEIIAHPLPCGRGSVNVLSRDRKGAVD